MYDEPGSRADASGELDGAAVSGKLENVLLGEGGVPVGEQPNGLRGAAAAAEGGDATAIFRYGGVWHARRQILNGRIVMGIGFTQELAVADLEAQWSVA